MPVDIHGKQYYTVVERLGMLKADHKQSYSIVTEIKVCDADRVIVRATLSIDGNEFTGLAEEMRNANHINKTSALENCETSAIGRALSSAGYFGTEFCSANELETALDQQKKPNAPGKPRPKQNIKFDESKENPITGEKTSGKTKNASAKQIGYIKKLMKDKGVNDDMVSDSDVEDMTSTDASEWIDKLLKMEDKAIEKPDNSKAEGFTQEDIDEVEKKNEQAMADQDKIPF